MLLIDDNRWGRALFSDVLAAMGCRVEAAASGEEGLALFARQRYQLVIANLEMAGGGGLEIAHAVRQHSPHIPVIVMIASAERLDELEGRLHGCTVLTKSVRLADFEDAVRRAFVRVCGEGAVK